MKEIIFRYPVRNSCGDIIEMRYWGLKRGCLEIPYAHNKEVIDLEESQQYTGLVDKTGTAIFEGDFVKFYTQEYKSGKISIVTMCKSGKWLPFNDDEYIQDEQGDWFISEKGFEIIGNIYENPELLKQTYL